MYTTKTLLRTSYLWVMVNSHNSDYYIAKNICRYKIMDCASFITNSVFISVNKLLLQLQVGGLFSQSKQKILSVKLCFLRWCFCLQVLLWLTLFKAKLHWKSYFQVLIVGAFSKPAEFHSHSSSILPIFVCFTVRLCYRNNSDLHGLFIMRTYCIISNIPKFLLCSKVSLKE